MATTTAEESATRGRVRIERGEKRIRAYLGGEEVFVIWIAVPARAESPWRQKQARKAAAVDAADLADDRK